MNIYDIVNNLSFSTSSYLENVFQVRIKNQLSKEKIDLLIENLKEQINNDYEENNISIIADNDSEKLNNIFQLNLNKEINSIIYKTGQEIYDNFISTHDKNTVIIYKVIEQKDFFNYFIFELKSLIPISYFLNDDIQKILEEIKQKLIYNYLNELEKYNEKINYIYPMDKLNCNTNIHPTDELNCINNIYPADKLNCLKDNFNNNNFNNLDKIKYIQKNTAILLINEEKILLKKEHEAELLINIMTKAIINDNKILDLFNKLLNSCKIIDIENQNIDFRRKTIIALLQLIFFNKIKYSELSVNNFISKVCNSPGLNFYKEKIIHKQEIYDLLLNNAFDPDDINKKILDKIISYK